MNNTNNAYCRLCAELKPLNELTNLQTDEETCQKVVNKLSRFNIVMDFLENILPKTVCLLCVKSLDQSFTFVTAVEQAQAFLSDFILVPTRTIKSDDFDEITFLTPSDIIKVENKRDPMDVNDDNPNLGEECDDEGIHNDDGNLVGSVEVHIKNKDTPQSSYIIPEEKINIKDESDDYTNVNSIKNIKHNDCGENQYINVKELYKLEGKLETEEQSKQINMAYSADYIDKLDYSSASTETMGTHAQPVSQPGLATTLDPTVYSEDYINKQINRLSVIPVEYLRMTWMDYEWKCSHCGTLFSNIEELQQHSLQYHNTCNAYQCTDCKIKKQRLNAFIKHVRSHRKYLHYSCYKCFEKFPKMMETIHHKKKIHENSKHICLGCNTPFSSNTKLEEHVKKYYNILWRQKTFINSDNLTCSTCNKVCTSITALRNHLNTHKEKKRDRICDRCGKCFDSEPSLKNHMETHIEKELYHCEICKATFKTVYSLRYHASIHSGIKPFTCDVCSKCFRTKSQITNHMKFHTNYFPITCSVCNKKFRTENYLQNHMLQHTGEKPYSCDICPRDFTNLANRNKHMRRRHGIEMAKKRQHIIKHQTAEVATSSDLATSEAKFTDLDKMNDWKNKIMVHQKNQRANNKVKKLKVISDECNEH